MKFKKKIDRKFNRRLQLHNRIIAVAKRRQGALFNPMAFKWPGNRNPKKT